MSKNVIVALLAAGAVCASGAAQARFWNKIAKSEVQSTAWITNDLWGASLTVNGAGGLVGGAKGIQRLERDAAGDWSATDLFFYDPADPSGTYNKVVALGDSYALLGLPTAVAGLGVVQFHAGGAPDPSYEFVLGPSSGSLFGYALAVDRGFVAVGAPGVDGGRGAAYAVRRIGGSWTRTDEFVPPAGWSGLDFGKWVDVWRGSVAVYVALGSRSGSTTEDSVYVYRHVIGTSGWTLDFSTRGFPTLANENAVALAGTVRPHLLVANSDGVFVRTYRRIGGVWSELDPALTPEGDVPLSAKIAAEDTTCVVAAGRANRAYVFRLDEATGAWSHEESLTGDECGVGFGTAVATDGEAIMVGAPHQTGSSSAANAGAIYAYERGEIDHPIATFDVHFVVLSTMGPTAKRSELWTEPETGLTYHGVELLEREVGILNEQFRDAAGNLVTGGVDVVQFRYRSHVFHVDLPSASEDLLDFGDMTMAEVNTRFGAGTTESDFFNQFAKAVRECQDTELRAPRSVNFYVIDNPFGVNSHGRSAWDFTNRVLLPYVCLDYTRLLHTNSSPEEHEMGHAFALGHNCEADNIMTSDCSGVRHAGFTIVDTDNHSCGYRFDQVPLVLQTGRKIQGLWQRLSTGSLLTFGVGCEGSNGVPKHTASGNPDVGGTVTYLLRRGAESAYGVFVAGFSRTTLGTIPLPVELPGTHCKVYSESVITELVTTGPAGVASRSVSIPSNPSLVGSKLFTQFWCFDAPANSWGLTMSNAVETTIGA